MSHPAIPATEVAELLRRAVRGEVSLRLQPGARDWNAVYAGNVAFDIGGWNVVVFNDCGELDYVAAAVAPDGRGSVFDDWFDELGWFGELGPTNLENPVDLLDADEFVRLEWLLEDAP